MRRRWKEREAVKRSWTDLPERTLQEILKHMLLSEAAGPNCVTEELSVGIGFLSDFW